MKAAREANRAGKAAGATLADVMTGAPPGSKAATQLGRVVEEATRLAVRDSLGADVFKALPNGALVPKQDHARILKLADDHLGIPDARRRKLLGGATPTPDEEARLAALAARHKVAREPGKLTTRDLMELRNGALRDVGGVLADTRYRLQGTERWVDQLWGAFQDLHLDRRDYGKMGEWMKKSPLAWIARGFAEDKLARLPPQVRSRMRQWRIRFERNSDDLLLEYRSSKELTPAARLLSIIHRYTPGSAVELERATGGYNPGSMTELRNAWKGFRPRWLDSTDPTIQKAGFDAWAKGVINAAADAGRRWVQSHLAVAGKDTSGTVLGDLVRKMDRDLALQVYREAFQKGDLQSPALQEALRQLGFPGLKLKPTDALVMHALGMRADALIIETLDEMMGAGVAFQKTDPRRSALHAASLGQHADWNEQLKRWEYRFPEAQITWALDRLRDWGIDPGSGAAFADTAIGHRQLTVPKYLADYLNAMVGSAQLDSRGVFQGNAVDILLRAFKEWTTHGVILPNHTHFTGQMLSLLPTMVTTRGLTEAARAGSTLVMHPLTVGGLMKRLATGGSPTFASRVAEQDLIRAADGTYYTMDDLEAGARRNGLQDTPASFETAEQLKEVVARDGADYRWLDPRRLLMPAAWWQRMIREGAGAFDQAGRMSVYVDLVQRGVPIDVAAQQARQATLDFRDLTDWEAKWMRKVFTFYAFLRKNSDAYVKALFRNPGRVMGQMRLAHASLANLSGLSPLELGAMRDDDVSRLTIYDDDEVVNDQGRPHPLYRMNRLQSTPLGVGEFMATMKMLLGADAEKGLSSLNPLLQTIGILAQGRKLDREYDSPHANRIPPVLMDSFLGPYLMDAFAVGPVALRANEDVLLADDDASHELGSGEPAVWAAGGNRSLTPEQQARARDRWQLFLQWFGRPVATLQQTAEAAGGLPVPIMSALPGTEEPVPPSLTQNESTTAWLLGLRYRPALAESEAVRRELYERERTFREAEKNIRLPDRSTPR